MSGAMHIVRKDVRRLRWVLALWVAVLAARVALSLNGAAAAGDPLGAGLFLQELSGAIGMVELLLTALIVARLVHEEPLVGFTAFWLTRPYDIGNLVRAKFLFAVAVLVALPLAADLATMWLLGSGAPALVSGSSTAAVGYASWMLSLMVIATLTPSLGVFVLTMLGIVAGASMLLVSMLGLAFIWTDELSDYTPPGVPDATPGVVMLAVYLCAALSVILYQYRHRRWRVAVALAVAGLAASVVVPMLWPWAFARGEEIRPGEWAASTTAVHDPSWGTEATDVTRFGRGAPRRHVNARVTLTGVPPQVTVQTTGVRGRLQFPDGVVIESSQAGGYASPFRAPAVEAALGGVRLLSTRDIFEQPEAWTPMITITENEFARRRGRPGRLDADVDFHLLQTREVGVLPLTSGAAVHGGLSRIEIVAVQRRTGGIDVTVRQWRAQSLLSAEPAPTERLFALRHRSRGEALMGGIETGWALGGRGNAAMALLRLPFAMMGAGFGVSAHASGGGFSAGTSLLRFPGPGFGKAPPLDPGWFDEAELVVLEAEQVGVVTRRLAIEEFAVPAN